MKIKDKIKNANHTPIREAEIDIVKGASDTSQLKAAKENALNNIAQQTPTQGENDDAATTESQNQQVKEPFKKDPLIRGI